MKFKNAIENCLVKEEKRLLKKGIIQKKKQVY